jgi:hypothetical protein
LREHLQNKTATVTHGEYTSKGELNIAAKPRVPAKPKLARAGHDMHDRNPKVRKEAAEVLAVAPRKKSQQTKGK